MVESWLQHLRMLDRMTLADQAIVDVVGLLHSGEGPPLIRHGVSYIANRYENDAATRI